MPNLIKKSWTVSSVNWLYLKWSPISFAYNLPFFIPFSTKFTTVCVLGIFGFMSFEMDFEVF